MAQCLVYHCVSVITLLVLNTCHTCRGTIPIGCNGLLDLTFVLDQSESIRENDPINQPNYNWNLLKSFVKGVIKDLPVGTDTHVAMVKYSTDVHTMWNLGKYTYAYDLDKAVDDLEHLGGNTNTAGALEHVRDQVYVQWAGDRSSHRNIMVLLTDGLSTVRQADLKNQAQLTRNNGTEIYVVAIGGYTDEVELREVVEDFSKHIIKAEDFERLAAIQRLLVHRVCGLPDPKPDDRPPTDCNYMDIAFIVDNSGSINDDHVRNYKLLKEFLTNLVNQLEIGFNKTRVGVVRFSEQAKLEFTLNQYYDKRSINHHLNNMPYEGSHTNAASGIKLAMSQLFNGDPSRGDRRGVPNVGIIITDGVSTRDENQTVPEATQAKRMGVQLFAIAITTKVNEDELKEIVSPPDNEHYFDATNIAYLNSILYKVIENICRSLTHL